MKANLTRGNSVTENHNPFETLEDCFIIAFAVVSEAIEKSRAIQVKRLNKYPIGGVPIVGEEGAVMKLKKGFPILSVNETRNLLKLSCDKAKT